MRNYSVAAHADWSTNPAKRWMAEARRQDDGSYLCVSPKQIIHADRLMEELRQTCQPSGCALIGFDFPIGLPIAYAYRAGITSFLSALPQFGEGDWIDFYTPAGTPGEIDLHRPFYPARAGGARRNHLSDRLKVGSFDGLRRECERAHPTRRAACPLFWTMGAQQVGKAAISGWREVLLEDGKLPPYMSIWPFSGGLDELAQAGRVVVAETYPAEFYHHLGVSFTIRRGERSGKRSQAARKENAGVLLSWSSNAGVRLTRELREIIQDGFGATADGEDRFDAVIGLLGILNVLLGHRPPGDPDQYPIRTIEGWILGQS